MLARREEFLATQPKQSIPRVSGHYTEWLEACKGGKPASGGFEPAVPLTRMVLLGNVALQAEGKICGTLAS